MKRTSVTERLASILQPFRQPGGRRFLLLAGFAACAAAGYFLGYNPASAPEGVLRELAGLRAEILIQQREVDKLRASNSQNVKALSARLAELQAASTRLDALGERLAQMGQLSLDEFDFSKPAPVGGPAESLNGAQAGEMQLQFAIDALGEKLRRQSTYLDALQSLMVNRQLEQDLKPSGWPVSKGWISSRYGKRNDPFTGEPALHRGLDFAGTRGTDVHSVASGVVIWAGNRASYGRMVEIDHGNGYRTRYAHNEDIVVRPGDHVSAGQVIAHMGSSGRASAPHVHFEVLKDGARINPSRYVSHLR